MSNPGLGISPPEETQPGRPELPPLLLLPGGQQPDEAGVCGLPPRRGLRAAAAEPAR